MVSLGFGDEAAKAAILDEAAGVSVSAERRPRRAPRPEVELPENLFEDPSEASQHLHDIVVGLSENPPALPQLIVSTPGIGKTMAALHLARRRAIQDDRVVYASTNHDMMWQAYDRLRSHAYGVKAVVLEGRHGGYTRRVVTESGEAGELDVEANCERHDRVMRAAAKGYPPHAFVCHRCYKFPYAKNADGEPNGFNESCEYYKRKWQASGYVPFSSLYTPVIVTTHAMVANLIGDQKAMEPDWVIVDEDPVSALRETFSWTEQELAAPIRSEHLSNARALYVRMMDIAERTRTSSDGDSPYEGAPEDARSEILATLKSCEEFGQIAIWGKAMLVMLTHAARSLGVDLDEVLANAQSSGTGVEKGELMRMTEERFAQIPHYREPDIAQAIAQVVYQARNDDERAYRISFRWQDGLGWSLVYDFVRRLNYEGNLVLLDAYGDDLLAERYCGVPVEKQEVRCKVRSNVTVKRYPHVRTSRSAMDPIDQRNAIYDDFVTHEVQRLGNLKVLFYTQKRYRDWLEERVKQTPVKLKATGYKWWWQDRGDDDYKDFDALIIMGSPYPNISAERYFANAHFAGEPPLSWNRVGGKYEDSRIAAQTAVRREKELLQATYRLRLARPNPKPQTVVIFSAMALPVELEMPGAVSETKERPFDLMDDDTKRILSEDIITLYQRLGFWADTLAGFIFVADDFRKWLDGEGELPIDYLTLKRRVATMRTVPLYEAIKRDVLTGVLHLRPLGVHFSGKHVPVWGDQRAAIEMFSRLKQAYREPGIDDDPLLVHPEDGAIVLPFER